MNRSVPLFGMTVLLSALAIQCSDDTETIPAFKDFSTSALTSSLQVKLTQNGTTNAEWVGGRTASLPYSLSGGAITIKAVLSDPEASGYFHAKERDIRNPQQLLGKAIKVINQTQKSRVVVDREGKSKNVPDYDIAIELVNSPYPPESKCIRAYKTTGLDKDWTVNIINENRVAISDAKFKKNTKYLCLAINKHPITDPNNSLRFYNSNMIELIKTPGAAAITLLKDIKSIPSDSELEISDNEAKWVPKGTEASYKLSKKKIRAYKVAEKDKDWTIVVVGTKNNNEGQVISKSTFKKNTDRFAGSIYLNDKENYGDNLIKVFKGKKTTGVPFATSTIKAVDVKPELELKIDADGKASLVPAGGEPQ